MHILTGPSYVLSQISRHHQNCSSFMDERLPLSTIYRLCN